MKKTGNTSVRRVANAETTGKTGKIDKEWQTDNIQTVTVLVLVRLGD